MRGVWAAGAAVLAVYALTAAPGRLDALSTAEARGAANAELVAGLRRFDDNPELTRALRRCDRVGVRDQRVRALLVDELGVPVDRVVDARRTAVGARDVFVTVDDRTMRDEQPALFPAHPTPPAAALRRASASSPPTTAGGRWPDLRALEPAAPACARAAGAAVSRRGAARPSRRRAA